MATSAATPPRAKLPLAVYALALGVFVIGTSEFMVAGLLPEIAGSLGVSIARAGLLITAFAVGMTIGAPVMAAVTLALPRRLTLLGALAVVAVAHLAPLTLGGYGAQAAARVVAAVATATYWAVASVIAIRLAGPAATGRALAAVVTGLTVANILGVPGGTWLGERLGWRAPFVVLAASAVAVLALLRVLVPAEPRPAGGVRLRTLVAAETRAFRDRRLWLALATTATFQAAVFCTFSYVAPLLTDVTRIGEGRVGLVLLVFGLGSALGVTIGGRYADRDPLRNVFWSLGTMALALLLLITVADWAAGTVVALFAFGATAFSVTAAISARVLGFASSAPTLAAAFNVAAFNVGNAVGPWLGGLLIDAGWGLRAPLWASVVITLLAIGIATRSWWLERRPAYVCAGVGAGACRG